MPNGGAQVYWRDWTTREDRPTPPPDLPVALTGRDYRAGRDPVLAAALTFTPQEDLGEDLVAAWRRAGINSALQIWWKVASDPATADQDTQGAVLDLGRALLDDGEAAYAQAVFGLALRSHPGSAAAHLGLARALLATGELKAARQSLEEAARLGAESAAVEALRRRLAEGPGG